MTPQQALDKLQLSLTNSHGEIAYQAVFKEYVETIRAALTAPAEPPALTKAVEACRYCGGQVVMIPGYSACIACGTRAERQKKIIDNATKAYGALLSDHNRWYGAAEKWRAVADGLAKALECSGPFARLSGSQKALAAYAAAKENKS